MPVIPPTPIGTVIGAVPASAPTTGGSSLGKDAFLKLLVAQLRYQDPTNPTDSAQFMAQTAQFTQVEKLEEIAAAIAESLSAQSLSTVSALLGRTVSYLGADGVEISGVVTGASFSPVGALVSIGGDGTAIPVGDITAVRTTP
ncbi:MAG: flagellar hook capping FlgD N-terminal domain-containing protein [Sporichthyaceae bacterium]